MKETGISVVDYVLCRSDLLKCLTTSKIDDQTIISDHCLHFALKINKEENQDVFKEIHSNENTSNTQNTTFAYMWNDELNENHVRNTAEINNTFIHLANSISNISSVEEIDQNLQQFYDTINKICTPLFGKTMSKNLITQIHLKRTNKNGSILIVNQVKITFIIN